MEQVRIPKSARKRIVDTVKQYFSVATIHGLAYLCGNQISRAERLLWALIVLLALYFATYQVSNLYSDWQENPVVTTLDTVAYPIDEIDFPAVTICPQGSRQEIMDLVLFRQLTEYIRNSTDRVNSFTEEEIVDWAVAFLNNVYPGASANPTLLTRLMTSDNPKVYIENEAVLKMDEECDGSSNADFTQVLNKQLKNDTCPKEFEMAHGSNFCLHVVNTPMTYSDASQHCNDLRGSSLLYLENVEDIDSSNKFLNILGNSLLLVIVRKNHQILNKHYEQNMCARI